MKIYTKQGDQGETGLYGGKRVPKNHMRIEAYGALDELNATLGIILSELETSSSAPECNKKLKVRITRIQNQLFRLGAELATPKDHKLPLEPIQEGAYTLLENEIDEMESKLPALKNFILPGGSKLSALFHLSRTICRRAEREMVHLHQLEPIRTEALIFINRLSDYLFVCARFINHEMGIQDIPWSAKG